MRKVELALEEEEETVVANFLLIIFTTWAANLCLIDENAFIIFVAKLEARLWA